ncbi:MAG: hypothetical protein JXA20_14800 [Spirochaetes bacterium]|nr:hypothetical protein [Spirochaetota bacterium]
MRGWLSVAAMAFLLACQSAEVVERIEHQGERLRADPGAMKAQIEAFNGRAVSSFEGKFSIDGILQHKRYRTLGNVSYLRERGRMNLSIIDFIFRSTLTSVVQDGRELSLYFPVDKKLYIDSVDTLRLRNYGGIDFQFPLLHELFTGRIPMIPGYRITRGERDEKTGASFLVIENRALYETISLKEGMPDRLLFVDRTTGKRVEFYLGNPANDGGSVFFRSLRVLAADEGVNLSITFSGLKLNGPVRVKSLQEMKIPAGVSVIRM